MLILERTPSNDFLLTDVDSNESILMPHSIAIEIKNSVKTAGSLVQELYRLYGNNKKWKGILDTNLTKSYGNSARNTSIDENIMQLFDALETIE